MVLGAVAQLLTLSHEAVDHLARKDRTTLAAQQALSGLLGEAREGLTWVPHPEDSRGLAFEKVDPAADLFDPTGSLPWPPASARLVVGYHLESGHLIRTAGATRQTLATGLAGFEWSHDRVQVLRVRLSVEESKKVMVLESEVRCPLQ